MIRSFSIRLAISLICLILASCAVVEPKLKPKQQTASPPEAWASDQQKRRLIEVWEIRGRLGVQTATNGGSMDIIWKQSDEDFSIRLIAPLGAGTYLIQGNNEIVDIRYPDGKKETVSNIDHVFASTLDVDLPVTAIRDWVRGLPAHALPVASISWNKQGLLHRLKQSGWNVEMTKYTGAKLHLPHAIYLNRDDKPDLDIRLVLRQWLLDN